MNSISAKQFVTEHQASKLTEIPLIEFQRGRWIGSPIPHVRVSGKIRYRMSDINSLLKGKDSK